MMEKGRSPEQRRFFSSGGLAPKRTASLQGTDFTLLGGRVAYLDQSAGAQLLYQLRKHRISVFIFPDRGQPALSAASAPVNSFSFNMESWAQNGLRYFVVGDVSAGDIQALSKLMRDAG